MHIRQVQMLLEVKSVDQANDVLRQRQQTMLASSNIKCYGPSKKACQKPAKPTKPHKLVCLFVWQTFPNNTRYLRCTIHTLTYIPCQTSPSQSSGSESRQNVRLADLAKRRHMILISDDDHDDEDGDRRSFPGKPVSLKPLPSTPFQLNISKNRKKTKTKKTQKNEAAGTRKSSESQSISFATSK